jgi:hypothetical protein
LAEAADERPPVTNVLASVDDSLDVANVIVGAMLGAQSSRPSGGRDERASINVRHAWLAETRPHPQDHATAEVSDQRLTFQLPQPGNGLLQ